MDIKTTFKNKTYGFYVGLVGAVLALVTLFIYIGMDSMFFTGWVVAGLIVGIVLFVLAAIFKIRVLYVLSYACYMFALYHFLTLEIDYRMDALVDEQQGFFSLDGIFYVACIAFLACIIVTIVASCLKQDKTEA